MPHPLACTKGPNRCFVRKSTATVPWRYSGEPGDNCRRRPVCAGALLYALYYWLDRLFLSDWLKSRTPPANLAFSLGLTLVLLVFMFWTLSRPKIKVIFGEAHERSS